MGSKPRKKALNWIAAHDRQWVKLNERYFSRLNPSVTRWEIGKAFARYANNTPVLIVITIDGPSFLVYWNDRRSVTLLSTAEAVSYHLSYPNIELPEMFHLYKKLSYPRELERKVKWRKENLDNFRR